MPEVGVEVASARDEHGSKAKLFLVSSLLAPSLLGPSHRDSFTREEATYQPAGLTNGDPRTAENSARIVKAVTPIAMVPIHASDVATRSLA